MLAMQLFLPLAAASGPVSFSMHGADWLTGSCISRTAQSPVDFEALKLPPTHELTYDYPALQGNLTISAKGHAVELSTGTSMGGGVMLDGEFYSLLYVDLHSPAEHTVRGVRAPLEIQLYHKAAGNPRLAVLSVLVTAAAPPDPTGPVTPYGGEPSVADQDFNADLQPLLLRELPHAVDTQEVIDVDGFSLANLMKPTAAGNATFWMYDGSMTAPPCAETVRWFVRREQLLASDAQIRVFDAAMRNMTSLLGNYRTTMPWNDRKPIVWRSKQGPVGPVPPSADKPHGRLRSGPFPRTDNELQAVKQAELADALGGQAVEYVKDLETRIGTAADQHLENLQGQRKVAEEEGMRRAGLRRAAAAKAKEEMPPVVQKHFMPLVRDLAEQAAQKVIAGVRKVAHDAASSVTKPVRVEAARQQYAVKLTKAVSKTPEQLAKEAAAAAR